MLTSACWGLAAPPQIDNLVVSQLTKADFPLVSGRSVADVWVDPSDSKTVILVAGLFADDVARVTGRRPRVRMDSPTKAKMCVIAGTIDNNRAIRDLIKRKKIDVSTVEKQWESCLIQVVNHPLPGIDKALVVVGSDRRGTAYGLLEISKQMGVSPWYYFADVAPKKRDNIIIRAGRFIQKSPSVKYRGIFINDEMWGLRPWAMKPLSPEEGHGIGPKTYAKIFELILRIKGNYLWPAMHEGLGGTIPFNYYESNKVVADQYGIVMGSSHIEPMLRNNIRGAEWDREYPGEPWDYLANKAHIYKYWEDRIRSNGKYENVYTVGKRGKDDQAGSEITPPVLEQIIADQRTILRNGVNKDFTQVPQVLIAYTEVLALYNKGLSLPDDVTICWPDDNYGYIRQLPDEREQRRSGGSGIYYHLQWLNGASNAYTWLSTTSLGLIWEEMKRAYDYNARKLWVVNVGDIKPAEVDIEYFMDLAWNITPSSKSEARRFLMQWASREFGERYSVAIADLMEKHYELNFARRPEHMVMQAPGSTIKWDWFSLVNHSDEAQLRADAFEKLIKQVEALYDSLPVERKDSFYQTVLYNVKCAALHNMKVIYAQKSAVYGAEGRASAAEYALKARNAASEITKVINHYNTGLVTVGSKWNYMASLPGPWGGQGRQWDMPPLSDFDGRGGAALGLGLEGGGKDSVADLSSYTRGRRFIDLFNTGQSPLSWKAITSEPWLKLDQTSGRFTSEQRLWISVDWNRAPKGKGLNAVVDFETNGGNRRIRVPIFNPALPERDKVIGFVESHGYVSMEAEHYTRKQDRKGAAWQEIEGVGRNGTCMAAVPSTVPSQTLPAAILASSPMLEYDIYLFKAGEFELDVECLPTHPATRDRGIRLAVSMDNSPLEILAGRGGDVIANLRHVRTKVRVAEPGAHKLKIWMVDPGVVIGKIVLYTEARVDSYLGPPESFRRVGKQPS